MSEVTTYVGMDAHKKDLFLARLIGDERTPVTWHVPNEPQAIRRVVRTLEREAPGPVVICYEAGPCGYALHRQMTTPRVRCQVIAPALIPRKPGERVKTDRRDARKLAELRRAGLLTEVRPPTLAEEAVRDLCRARADAREDLQRCRHRLSTWFLRRGLHFSGRNWTRAHRQWIDSHAWEHPAEHAVVGDYVLALDQAEGRLKALDVRLSETAQVEPYREPVRWLRCFRGVDTLTAITLLAELHDFRRFESPRALMAYVGLVPSEDSSGETHRRGRITRAGNALVRRLLVEAAWHYQHRAGIGGARGSPRRSSRLRTKRSNDCVADFDNWPTAISQGRRSRGRLPVSSLASSGRCYNRDPSQRPNGGPSVRTATTMDDRGTNVRIGGPGMRYGPKRPNSRTKTARPPDEPLSSVLYRGQPWQPPHISVTRRRSALDRPSPLRSTRRVST